MLHTLLIAAHTICGLTALAFGSLALRPTAHAETPAFRIYLGALWLMILFLMLVLTLDWGTLDTTARLLFGALAGLALYMGWRGWRALQDLQHPGADGRGPYVDDIGFTLIALFDGFVVISARDLGAPVWLVVAIALLGIAVGRGALNRTKTLAAA